MAMKMAGLPWEAVTCPPVLVAQPEGIFSDLSVCLVLGWPWYSVAPALLLWWGDLLRDTPKTNKMEAP